MENIIIRKILGDQIKCNVSTLKCKAAQAGKNIMCNISMFFFRLNAIRNSTKRVSEDIDAAEELSPDKRQHLNASDEELLAAR